MNEKPKHKRAAKKKALRNRLEKMQENDPKMRLPKFVERVNSLTERFGRGPGRCDGRVNEEFTGRTVRHYQSKGIIDPPMKEGKEAFYGYRHVLQALLIRRMLMRKISAEKIADFLEGKDNEVYLKLLTEGISMSVGPGTGGSIDTEPNPAVTKGPWLRLPIIPGLEIHIARGFQPPEGPEEFRAMMQQIGQTIRQVVRRRRQRIQDNA